MFFPALPWINAPLPYWRGLSFTVFKKQNKNILTWNYTHHKQFCHCLVLWGVAALLNQNCRLRRCSVFQVCLYCTVIQIWSLNTKQNNQTMPCKWKNLKFGALVPWWRNVEWMIFKGNCFCVRPIFALLLFQGPVIKFNSNQRYATTAVTAAIVREVASKAGVPLQVASVLSWLNCGRSVAA